MTVYKDDPNDNLADSESFKSKIKITGKTPANGNTKDVEIITGGVVQVAMVTQRSSQRNG